MHIINVYKLLWSGFILIAVKLPLSNCSQRLQIFYLLTLCNLWHPLGPVNQITVNECNLQHMGFWKCSTTWNNIRGSLMRIYAEGRLCEVIQTLQKYINKREATYKCWVAQVHWAFLRFSIVQVNMSFIGFVEVFIVCWKMRLWVYVSGWFRGHCKKKKDHVKRPRVTYLISNGDCMFYTWWYHCKNHQKNKFSLIQTHLLK